MQNKPCFCTPFLQKKALIWFDKEYIFKLLSYHFIFLIKLIFYV